MIERLITHPLVFADLKMRVNDSPGALDTLRTDLRIRSLPDGGPGAEILTAKVVKQQTWDPGQTIYFEATSGQVLWTDLGPNAARLTGEVPGFYRRPVSDLTELVGDGDFLEAPVLPITMTLALNFRFETPEANVPQVSGTITLESEHLAPEFAGAQQVVAEVVDSTARLFSSDLPAHDLANEEFVYRVELRPLLVQGSALFAFQSTDRLLDGVSRLWNNQCGIEVVTASPETLDVGDEIMELVDHGDVTQLVSRIRSLPSSGVPVAFVPPLFAAGGGLTTDHGPDRAIVLVTDAVPITNTTLLAHEIGHVLGGKESGSFPTADYWVGRKNTVMHAKGSVKKAPPGVVGPFGCEQARRFARWQRK